MPLLRGWRPGAVGLAVIVLSGVPRLAQAAPLLTFEDMFGPCGDQEGTLGPGTVTQQGITFISPDVLTLNYGKGGSDPALLRTPFQSDWFMIHAYGPTGATVNFPEPVTSMSFDTGTRDVWVGHSFKVFVGPDEIMTFSSLWNVLNHVTVTFPSPTTTARVVLIEGSGSGSEWGLDNFTYTPVPEPAGAVVLAGALGCVSVRRGRRVTPPRTPAPGC